MILESNWINKKIHFYSERFRFFQHYLTKNSQNDVIIYPNKRLEMIDVNVKFIIFIAK